VYYKRAALQMPYSTARALAVPCGAVQHQARPCSTSRGSAVPRSGRCSTARGCAVPGEAVQYRWGQCSTMLGPLQHQARRWRYHCVFRFRRLSTASLYRKVLCS